MPRHSTLYTLCLVVSLTVPWLPCGAVEDLTFLHLSDTHVPHALSQTRSTVAGLPLGRALELTPYGVTSPPVSFAVVTGDLNEFSGGAGAWEQYLGLWSGLGVPVYHQLGNHDNTWDCGRHRLAALYGSPFYSFDAAGITFIGWDTATPQDPRPSITTEALEWLKSLMSQMPAGQPVIFFCHHPLDGREFAGAWERARLLDVLQYYNTVLVLVGHGHGARAWQVENLDMVMGGSTYGKRPGFGVVSIRDGVLRVCHQYADGEMVALLEKPITRSVPALRVRAASPRDGEMLRAPELLRARLYDADTAVEARWTIDGGATGEMARTGGGWETLPASTDLEPGAHTLRLEAADGEGRRASRTVSFWLDGGETGIASIRPHRASARATPLVGPDGCVYVAFTNGDICCYDAGSGPLSWARPGNGWGIYGGFSLDCESGTIYYTTEDGMLASVSASGADGTQFEVGAPIYAPPLLVGDRVIVATTAGDVVAVAKESIDEVLWRCDAPEYAIEAGMCASETAVYAGSWDGHVYAIDIATGAVNWRVRSAGSDRDAAPRYYSPADCAPVLVGNRLFVADRAYNLTILDADTGQRLGVMDKCVAVGPSPDGQAAYVRHTDNRVSRLDVAGGVVWTTAAPTGAIPAPPTAAHGRVLVASNTGVLTVLDAETGAALLSYRAFAESYVFGSPAYDGRYAYIVDAAGRMVVLDVRRHATR